jgi:hypothetical protein
VLRRVGLVAVDQFTMTPRRWPVLNPAANMLTVVIIDFEPRVSDLAADLVAVAEELEKRRVGPISDPAALSIVWRAALWVLVRSASNDTVCLFVLLPRSRSFGERRFGLLFPARRMTPFVSLSCCREVDRLASGALASCSQRVE